ncbi:MAG: signal peptidase II [Syntrophomonadaceae bacterium]|nr:signal peptidase II [Syntrophomonadaceae bacterium]
MLLTLSTSRKLLYNGKLINFNTISIIYKLFCGPPFFGYNGEHGLKATKEQVMHYWIVLVITLILDRWSKHLIMARYELGEGLPLLGEWLSILRVHNEGAAFSILQGRTTLFFVVGALVLAACVYYNQRCEPSRLEQFALGLVCGGAVGNLIDRALYGGVVDFISVGWWPVFNVADSAIVVGALLIAVFALRDMAGENRRQEEATKQE